MAEEFQTPLAEASPKSLVDLFSMDPLALTRIDRSAIVAEFRRLREVWKVAESQGKVAGTAKAPKGLVVKGSAPQLSLDDLLKK